MTIDQPTTDHPVWGVPDATPRRWRMRETAAAVGVAAVIAGFGGGAIYAATGSHTDQHAFGHGTPGGPRPGSPPGGGFGSPGPASLHGESVVSDGAGGYVTHLTQTGTVTEVSPTSITVRSADAYSQTYVIPPGADDDGSIALHDEVSVQATRSGHTATATVISTLRSPGSPGGPPGPAPHN